MKTALVIGDIQRGITAAYPFARQVAPSLTELLPRACKVVSAARRPRVGVSL
jgi:hypothetical protein